MVDSDGPEVAIYFSTFSAPLRRTEVDQENRHSPDVFTIFTFS